MKIPLTGDDAFAVMHMCELLAVTTSLPSSTIEDVERYAHARWFLVDLLRGKNTILPDEIKDTYLRSLEIAKRQDPRL